MGDFARDESCPDLISLLEGPKVASGDDVAALEANLRIKMRMIRRWEMKERMREKEYPPPIPLLARTENLPSHMPWVLKRTYTSDGRLVLCEERVRHHEYFRAHRSDGRLTLQLVPLDDQVFDQPEPGPDEPTCSDNNNVTDNGAGQAVSDGGGGVGKCLKVYNISGGVNVSGGSSSIFGMAVPAL